MGDFKFSVDAIYPADQFFFNARLIPVSRSEFFPPFHLETIRVSPHLLDKRFCDKYRKSMELKEDFTGSLVQGGYYEIPREIFGKRLDFKAILDSPMEQDVFSDHRRNSPFTDDHEQEIYLRSKIDGDQISEEGEKDFGEVSLYGFNVGQGDSLMLIANNGNSYIIDTNLYSRKSVDVFVKKIEKILSETGLSRDNLKGLIITHKHVDHIRGADVLIKENILKFSHFLINQEYRHPTQTVNRLLDSAKEKIQTWVNIDHPFKFREGETEIEVFNPTANTLDNEKAPDINDSSICLKVSYGNTTFILTGDAGFDVIDNGINKQIDNTEIMLKVSHHGSRTGTDKHLVGDLLPDKAFISVGYNKTYSHPHEEAINALKTKLDSSDISISRSLKRTIKYTSDGEEITVE